MDATASGRKKRAAFVTLLFLVMAIPPIVNSLDNPHLKGLRGPDWLPLIAIGMCIGGALGSFFVGFLGRRVVKPIRTFSLS